MCLSASPGLENLKKQVQNAPKLESEIGTFGTFGVSNGTHLGLGPRALGESPKGENSVILKCRSAL